MKTSLLTLAGTFALVSIASAANPKFGFTKPEIRSATVEAGCPMSTTERVTHISPFAKGGKATVTTSVVKHDPSCPMLQGRRCPAMES